jgi:hypothetical protein
MSQYFLILHIKGILLVIHYGQIGKERVTLELETDLDHFFYFAWLVLLWSSSPA